jgi:hypothetical protein
MNWRYKRATREIGNSSRVSKEELVNNEVEMKKGIMRRPLTMAIASELMILESVSYNEPPEVKVRLTQHLEDLLFEYKKRISNAKRRGGLFFILLPSSKI